MTRRAVLLTALPVEYNAVRAHLSTLSEVVHPAGTVYEHGFFASSHCEWQIRLAEIGLGNARAAMEAERAIEHFRPEVALFVGVAGGIKDVVIGDVVAASKVYGYEAGKAQAAFEPRPDVAEASYRLEQRARTLARSGDWCRRIVGALPEPSPRACVGPIAAGEKILANTRSIVFQFLRAQYGDTLAVEMEGRGFLVAARAREGVAAMVVRGISDLINGKTHADASGSQELASRHAAAFAFELLACLLPPEITDDDTDEFDDSVEKFKVFFLREKIGAKIPIVVPKLMRVRDIKQYIIRRFKIQTEFDGRIAPWELLCNGRMLDDSVTAEDSHLNDGDTLQLWMSVGSK